MEDSCIIFNDPTHLTIDFHNLPQVKGAIQIKQANALNYPQKPFNSPYSETYNLGWSKHSNFSWKSDGGHASSCQGNPSQNPFQRNPGFPNQNFQNQNFQNQGPQGFMRHLAKDFTLFPKEVKIINLTNLHIKEIWRTL